MSDIIPLFSHVGVLLEGTVQRQLSRGEARPTRAGGLHVGHQRGDERLCVTRVLWSCCTHVVRMIDS